jgi:hypothetical protein
VIVLPLQQLCYVRISLTLTHNLTSYSIPSLDAPSRYKQVGGSYGSIPSAMNGHRHHCFADWVYTQTTVNKYDMYHNIIGTVSASYSAPVILMTPEDHQATASYGSAGAAYRNTQLGLVQQGLYLQAMQMDIDDIHSKFGSRYDGAISEMWGYATADLRWYQ